MKTVGIVLSAVFAVVLVSGLAALSFSNSVKRLENGIVAQYSENQNVYDNGWKAVVETLKVTEHQARDLKDIFMGVTRGTYGENGSQALFQAMQERQINLDQSTYRAVQTQVASFRASFSARQQDMVSRCQVLDNLLTATTTGRFFNLFFSYPTIDRRKYCVVVTSSQTDDAFRTKQAKPIL